MKGLILKETQDRLAQLLNKKSKQQFANIVSRTAQDTFYKQVWRIKCEKIIKWEKEKGITSKMKKETQKKKKNSGKKKKASQQKIEKKKMKVKEKEKRIGEEAKKTMLGLVIEERKPFYYEL